jgi:hypothetical protein
MKAALRKHLREFVAVATLGAALTAVVVVMPLPKGGSGAAAHASLTRGNDYLATLRHRFERQPATGRSVAALRVDALQAMYVARLEAGLGSPFRTIEAALRDPWLPDSIRGVFASALLAQALSAAPPVAARHAVDSTIAAVVDSVVRAQTDPRRGEEVVRVGFELAAASGAVTPSEAAAAVALAAMSRDTELARRDVARLVVAAHKDGVSPLDILPLWRADRRFEVEQPLVYATRWAASRELISRAAALFEVLDRRRYEEPSSTSGDVEPQATRAINAVLRHTALRLAAERGAPPSPAIVQIAAAAPLARYVAGASTEEDLAAAWLHVGSLTPGEQRSLARAIVTTSVRLRPTAQDPVWFAGDKVPRPIDLLERHGIRAITFPTGMRPAWRDYTLQAIDRALTDARRVFPDLDLRGMRIHVGVKAQWPARAMALHDPESRTIYFPLASAPGVLAHEIGHDLDWQVARKVFGELGIYATDGTARRASQLLAAPVGRLTGASATGHANHGARFAAPVRPTEALARHVDWIVAAGLATMGRSNGFLSTVQDGGDALGNSTAPEPAQIDAAVSVITAATRIPIRTVAQIHASAEAPLVRDVVTRALASSIRMPWLHRAASPFDALGAARAILRHAADPRAARRCFGEVARAAGEPEWVGDVHALVADVRARDVLRRLQRSALLARRPSTNQLRLGLWPGPVDPDLREHSLEQLRRDIEWQLAAALVPPLAQASAVATCAD